MLRPCRVRWALGPIGRRSFAKKPAPPVQIFSASKKVAQKDAVCLHPDVAVFDYLRNEVADRLVDRLLDTQNRKYTVALDLGCHSGHIQASLCKGKGKGGEGGVEDESVIGDVEELYNIDSSSGMLERCKKEFPVGSPLRCHYVQGNEEELLLTEGVAKGKFDLIMSSLSLHWVNDLPGVLTQVRQALKPDGAFFGALLGGDTLHELRSSFILADQERLGGVGRHMSPLADGRDAAGLLQRAGFALPAVDRDNITVEYASAFELMEHVQMMAESGALQVAGLQQGSTLTKDKLMAVAAIYQELYGDPETGRVPATFQVLYITGWSPAPTQPKPAKRGSGTLKIGNTDQMV